MGELAQADPAEPELLEDRARASAAVAAVYSRILNRCGGGLDDRDFLAIYSGPFSVLAGERHAERAQERARLLVGLGAWS